MFGAVACVGLVNSIVGCGTGAVREKESGNRDLKLNHSLCLRVHRLIERKTLFDFQANASFPIYFRST